MSDETNDWPNAAYIRNSLKALTNPWAWFPRAKSTYMTATRLSYSLRTIRNLKVIQ